MDSRLQPDTVVFGRRGVSRSAPRESPARSVGRTPPHVETVRPAVSPLQADTPFVVHYKWQVGLLGLGLFVMAAKFASMGYDMLVTADHAGRLRNPADAFVVSGNEPWMFLIGAVVAALAGLSWIIQGFARGKALVIDGTGVSGFTLLGTKSIAWGDIDRVELRWHSFYKNQLTIHAALFSPSGGLGVTGIPITLGKVDRSSDQIIAAMQQFRPDIPVKRFPATNWLTRIFIFVMTHHKP